MFYQEHTHKHTHTEHSATTTTVISLMSKHQPLPKAKQPAQKTPLCWTNNTPFQPNPTLLNMTEDGTYITYYYQQWKKTKQPETEQQEVAQIFPLPQIRQILPSLHKS